MPCALLRDIRQIRGWQIFCEKVQFGVGLSLYLFPCLPLWLLKRCPEGNFSMNERARRAPVKFSLAFPACSHVSYLLFSVRSTIDCSLFHACPRKPGGKWHAKFGHPVQNQKCCFRPRDFNERRHGNRWLRFPLDKRN